MPGAIELPGTRLFTLFPESSFSVNGQRARANNHLLDSTENNDFGFTGVAQPFNIADAFEEVSVQAGNFGAEFGRAGGGILNVVTKSGTNTLQGTLLSRYQSQRFNSVSNVDKRNLTRPSVFSRNVYGFTVGGPVRKNKTFFFGGFHTNNLLFQETQSKLNGRHTFRYGVEFLKQLASQRPASLFLGQLVYTDAAGYSAFANFLDDFSGPSGVAQKDFGATVFYPDQFHQTYFFQDTWPPAPSLSLTLGLR